MSVCLDHNKVASIVSNVTEAMLDMTFSVSQRDLAEADYRRVCVLPTWGPHNLTIALICDEPSALKLASVMFDMENDELDDELIRDALNEISNMSGGQIKQSIAPDQELGLPTAVSASKFLGVVDASWQKYLLAAGETNIVVYIAGASAAEELSLRASKVSA